MVAIRGILKSFNLFIWVVIFVSCQLELKTHSAPSSEKKIYTDFLSILNIKNVKKIDLGFSSDGNMQESYHSLNYDNLKFPFELYQLLAREQQLSFEMKVYLNSNKELMVPTLILLSEDGQKFPMKSSFFYIENEGSEKAFLHTKWIAKISDKAKYFLMVISDSSEDGKKIQSGITSYFSPTYFNFTDHYKVVSFAKYNIKVDLE